MCINRTNALSMWTKLQRRKKILMDVNTEIGKYVNTAF